MSERIAIILKMDSAIRLLESAQKTGDQVTMDVTELYIEECKRKLGVINESEKN